IKSTTLIASYTYDGVTVAGQQEVSVVDLTITPEKLVIEGPRFVREGLSAPYFTALYFSDGTKKAVPGRVSVQSQYCRVDAGNRLHVDSQLASSETAHLIATYRGFVACADVDLVKPQALPKSAHIKLPLRMESGQTEPLRLNVLYEDGSTVSIGSADWTFSNPKLLQMINDSVLAGTVYGQGCCKVTARVNLSGVNLETSAVITVFDPNTTALSLDIIGPDSIGIDDQAVYRAQVRFKDGSTADVDGNWSATGSVTVVDGLVKPFGAGIATLDVFYVRGGVNLKQSKEIIVV